MNQRNKSSLNFIKLFFYLILPCCLFQLTGYAGNPVDSLLRVIRRNGPDSGKVMALNKLGWEMFNVGKYNRAMDYTAQSEALAIKINYPAGLADSYNVQGVVLCNWGDNVKALEKYFKSLRINEQIHNERSTSRNLMNIGIVHMYLRDFTTSLKYLSKSLASCEKREDKSGIGKCLANMALVYRYQANYDKSLEFYEKSLKLNEELGNDDGIANNFLNIGILYKDLADTAMLKEDAGGASKNYSKSLGYYQEALKIQAKIRDKAGMAYSLAGIAGIYMTSKKFPEALNYLAKAKALAEELDSPELIWSNTEDYAEVNKQMGNYKTALEYREKAMVLKDNIFSDENKRIILQKEMQFEYEKKEATMKASSRAETEKIQAIASHEKKKQQVIIVCVGTGLVLVIFFALFMFNRYKITNRQKKIIELQKHEVEEKNREIQDSIIYAQRLQKAILPPQEYLDKHLPENFVLYKPKDIVAGDFYWLEAVNPKPESISPADKNAGSEKEYILIAVADSTGHGVPGAMVSVVCSNALNRAVLEFGLRDTGKILDKATDIVLETFIKSGEDIKDGMDISLLAINRRDRAITWSGANNSLWYVTPGSTLISNVPADKQPVGKSDRRKPFTSHQIPFEKGTVFYLITDGFSDQFGGVKGKKFKSKHLQTLFLDTLTADLREQKKVVDQRFEDWKKGFEQVDDVCIIGLRI